MIIQHTAKTRVSHAIDIYYDYYEKFYYRFECFGQWLRLGNSNPSLKLPLANKYEFFNRTYPRTNPMKIFRLLFIERCLLFLFIYISFSEVSCLA